MAQELGRGKRNKNKPNSQVTDVEGFTVVKKKRQRRNTKLDKVVEEPSEQGDNHLEEGEETPQPGTSGVEPGNNESNNSQDEEMGDKSPEREIETSDVDSEELERQENETKELQRLAQEKRMKRSAKQKRERKARMAALKEQAELARRQLEEPETEDEPETEKIPRNVSKSKDGKGVKSSKTKAVKGKKIGSSSKSKRVKKHKRNSSSSSIGESSSSVNEEFQMAIEKAKRRRHRSNRKRVRTGQKGNVNKKVIVEKKKRRRDRESTSEDSSPDSASSTETSTSSDRSECDSGSDRKKRKRKHKKGKPLKSGVKSKAYKIRLKTSELCPQAVLDEEHFPGNYSLEELTFEQLVAGELEICTLPDIGSQEKEVRMQNLKLFAYFAVLLPQSVILDVYKAVILKVEKGLFKWCPSLTRKTEAMLDRAVSKNRSKNVQTKTDQEKSEKMKEKFIKDKPRKELGFESKQGEKVIYCLDFNKGKCEKEQSHMGKFGGKDVLKQHICRACLVTEKEKRSHSEIDETCPNKTR